MSDAVAPLHGALACALWWLAIGALGLSPARNAFFARRVLFPLGALAGLALAAFGLEAI